MTKPEVLIVGAGPTGLMMACQLAIRNIPFRIIDKNEDHTTQSRALGIHARSMEIFEQMGIAHEALQLGQIAKAMNFYLNGKRRLKFNLKNIGEGLTQFPFLMILEQSKTEKLLNEFINHLGYYVERNTELLDFIENNNHIKVLLKDSEKEQESLQVKWLIGADGATSLVRRKLKISFEGKTYKESLYVLDCETTMDLPKDEMCVGFSKKTFALLFPMTNGRTRVVGVVPEESQDKEILTFEDVATDFAKRTQLNLTLKNPQWISMYHSHQRSVSSFRMGNCFLAGDAAHIHSPVGAQGMNTGLQDAYNLAWKLALVINGKAHESLLDTYNDERIVIARNLVRTTDKVFNVVISKKKSIAFFRLHFMPAFLKLFLPIFQRVTFIRRAAFRAVSEIALHYRFSKLSDNNDEYSFPDKAPKPGDRVPYFPELQRMFSGTKFHLLLFIGEQNDVLENDSIQYFTDKYDELVTVHTIYFNDTTKAIYRKFGIANRGHYFIRPDCYIAFRSDTVELEQLTEYMNGYLTC